MRRRRDEVALSGERAVKPGEHSVKRVGQLLELVSGAVQRDPLAQVLARDAARGGGDLAQRRQRSPGQQPADQRRQKRHRDERDHVLQQQRVQRLGDQLVLDGRDQLGVAGTHG